MKESEYPKPHLAAHELGFKFYCYKYQYIMYLITHPGARLVAGARAKITTLNAWCLLPERCRHGAKVAPG
jgi:hypothetical protein